MSTLRRFSHSVLLAAAGAGSTLLGCGSNGQQTTDSSIDAASTASELVAAQSSLASVQSVASTCFDAYRTCAGSSGRDAASCRKQLSSCLPTDAPPPPSCTQGAGGKSAMAAPDDSRELDGAKANAGGAGPGERVKDRNDREERTDMNSSEGGGRGAKVGAGDPDQHEVSGWSEAAGRGAKAGAGDGDKGQRAEEGRDGTPTAKSGKQCSAPPIPREKLTACRDAVSTTLAQRTDAFQVSAAHRACLSGAFESYTKGLCQSGTQLCENPNAPANACSSIKQYCSNTAAN